jgi:hypothetical protein
MRRLLPLLLLALSAPAWGAYTYKATITLAQTTGSSDLTDRTNIVYLSHASLKLAGNGGQIQHTVSRSGQTVPADLIFTSDSGGSVVLNWGIESYDGSSTGGVVWAHVKKTTSHIGTTVIYAFWGNTAISAFQGGAVGSEFDSSTILMSPFPGLTGGCAGNVTYRDFTSAANDGTSSCDYGSSSGGVVGGYAYDTSATSFPASSAYNVTTGTIALWVNPHTGYCSGGSAGLTMFAGVGSDYYLTNGFLLGCSPLNGYIAAMAGSGGTNPIFMGTSVVPENAWHHVAMTFTNGGTSTFYFDGASAGTFTPTIGSPGTSAFKVDGNFSIVSAGNGGYDNMYFTNNLRSADWIAAEYNNGHAPSTFAAVSGLAPCSGSCGGGSAAAMTMTPIIL